MISNHVLNKEIQSTEPSLMDAKDFASLVTEEMLYRRMIDNHKMFMLLLILFHFLLIAFTCLGLFYRVIVVENVFFCSYANNIQNCLYLTLNFLLAHFAFSSIFKNKVTLGLCGLYMIMFIYLIVVI